MSTRATHLTPLLDPHAVPPLKDFVLFSYPSMQPLAEEILAHPAVQGHGTQGEIRWDAFPDGYPNLFISQASSLASKRAVILLSFHDKKSLFEQISVLFTLPRLSVKSLSILLAYFPTGTMERVDTVGQVATAKSLSRILSSCPSTSRGPPHVIIYDIHALQEQFYFADNILPHLETAVPLLVDQLEREDFPGGDCVTVAFPDEGAYKRFHRLLPDRYPTITCMKIREGTKRKVSLMEGEPQGRHVVIIDDLVQSGGTLMECKNLLLRLGATRVSCFVTHAVFPNQSWRRFVEEDASTRFYRFFVTNSCPEITQQLQDQEPFQVLSLADSFVSFLSGHL